MGSKLKATFGTTGGGGGDLVAEETCWENFSPPNFGAIFAITFNDCGGIFLILFFGHQVQNWYPVLGGGGGDSLLRPPPIRGHPISQSRAHIPLKPLPLALDPFPEATSPCQGNKQKLVKHRGPLTTPLCKFYFFIFDEPSFLS